MIIKEEIEIKYLKCKRMLHIYLPDDLGEDEYLPVLYMFDGHNLFSDSDATYGKAWGLGDYFSKHHIRVIIVGMECNHEGDNRLLEYAPYDWYVEELGKSSGKEMFNFIIDDLKPYIDWKYQTLPDRLNTFIGGAGMGGLMALYGITMLNKYFSKAIVIAPHHDFCIRLLMEDIDRAKISPKTKIYLSFGANEFKEKKDLAVWASHNFKIVNSLSSKCEIHPHLYLTGKHDETSWGSETKIWLEELGI